MNDAFEFYLEWRVTRKRGYLSFFKEREKENINVYAFIIIFLLISVFILKKSTIPYLLRQSALFAIAFLFDPVIRWHYNEFKYKRILTDCDGNL